MVATVQGILVYGQITLLLYLLPTLAALTIGTLLARYAVLKERLRRTSAQFRAIADLAQQFTYLRLLDGRYVYASPACQRLTGYSQQDFYRDPELMDRLILPEDAERWRSHLQRIEAGGGPESFDVRLRARDRRTVWFRHVCVPVCDETGRQIGVRSTNLDITERKLADARIERMAYYDPLTGLPNRTAVNRLVRELIGEDPERRFALRLLDLNRFKNINDSLGHSFGDRLLKLISERFRQACPGAATLARFGGDEFALLLPEVGSFAQAEETAAGLLSEIEKPLKLEGTNLYLTASIGVAFFPDNGRDPDTLVRNADLAMYASKSSPTQTISFYADRFGLSASQFASTEAALQQALRKQEFVPFYQAKVDLRSGRIVGLEALARWRHPSRGLVTPLNFRLVAEETGRLHLRRVHQTAAARHPEGDSRAVQGIVAGSRGGRPGDRHPVRRRAGVGPGPGARIPAASARRVRPGNPVACIAAAVGPSPTGRRAPGKIR
jgi:diguanylate cyclase (GGDEF)-like protein/PAS domain S-box-containing protein